MSGPPTGMQDLSPPRPRKVRRPILFRISRWLHLAGTIVVVVLIVVLATIAYSAAHLGINNPSGSKTQTSFGPNFVEQSTTLNLTNGGLYSITGVSFAVVTFIVGGAVVGQNVGPSTTVAPGQTYDVPIVINISVAPGSPGQQLLVSSLNLGTDGWFNATMAGLLTVSVEVSPQNQSSWNPPFAGFSVRVTTAGTSATVTISFTNRATIPVVGTMAVTLSSTSGTSCGTANIPVNAPSQGSSPYSAIGTATLSPGCTPATALAAISGSTPTTYTFTLPQVNVQ